MTARKIWRYSAEFMFWTAAKTLSCRPLRVPFWDRLSFFLPPLRGSFRQDAVYFSGDLICFCGSIRINSKNVNMPWSIRGAIVPRIAVAAPRFFLPIVLKLYKASVFAILRGALPRLGILLDHYLTIRYFSPSKNRVKQGKTREPGQKESQGAKPWLPTG